MHESTEQKILGLIGLAARAGQILYGKKSLRSYIKSYQNKKLIIIPRDAGPRVKLDIIKHCEIFDVPYIEINKNKFEFAKLLGKENVSIIGIKNENIVEGILKLISSGGVL